VHPTATLALHLQALTGTSEQANQLRSTLLHAWPKTHLFDVVLHLPHTCRTS
jgi:hypothetical protein